MLTEEEKRMDIDELVKICGHFTDCETNNGYGCDHPENKGEYSGNPKECHRTGCPVAWYDSDKDEMVVFNTKILERLQK